MRYIPFLHDSGTMRCSGTSVKTASSTMPCAYNILAFLILAFFVSPVASLGLRASTLLPELRIGSFASDQTLIVSPSPTPTPTPTAGGNPETDYLAVGYSSRRGILGAVLAVAITSTVLPTMPSSVARAEATTTVPTTVVAKSNFNYELGNGECQTACVRKCELASLKLSKTNRLNNKNSNGDCIDACVRSGQRYCHQITASKSSPSAAKATTSRYVATTKEPRVRSSKPIPGLLYNSNRGGAWRD